MKTTLTPFKVPFFLAALALFLMGTTGLRAVTAGIQDNAGFFSDAAKADAQGNITLLQRTLKKDLSIETFPTIPEDVKRGVNLEDKAAAGRMYEQWAVQRAKAQNVNGVYILLVKEPSHLQVEVGNATQKQAFTLADRDTLVQGMLGKLRAKDYDAALRQGAAFVLKTMKGHAGTRVVSTTAPAPVNTGNSSGPAQTSSSSGGSGILGWIIIAVVVFIGFRLLMGLFRMITGGGGGGSGMNAGGQMGGGGGGGGFMRSLLGGVLGAAAGSWMYDNFFGSHGSSAYGAPPQDQGGGGFSGQDTDYSGSGGSFGDDSGSSSGGGGFDSGGGGDFGGGGGGGDSGGGGGDSGGGGGDSGGGGGGDF